MDCNLNTIREKGFRALVREPGAADTVNFLRRFENGSGNYTEERERALAGITVDEIAARL
jgi:hypothetical protein